MDVTDAKQSSQTNDNQVESNNNIKQAGHDQDEDACDQRDARNETDGNVHGGLLSDKE